MTDAERDATVDRYIDRALFFMAGAVFIALAFLAGAVVGSCP